MRRLTEEMTVDVPEGSHGNVTVERFEVRADSLENVRLGSRACQPGTYTSLSRGGRLWMSDTTAERRDHLSPAMAIAGRGWPGAAPARRVLIAGLGLGMILQVALATPEVEEIDVVEIDPDVVALVGPHYEKRAADAGVDLRIHQADIFEVRWPPGTHWEVAWFDIWESLSTDNLDEMARLARSYGRRADWKGYWGKDELRRLRAQGGWWR